MAEKGAVVGRYVIEGLIGSGGMGEVYKAYDPELKRYVALKQVRLDRDVKLLDRLKREASILAQLNHPNICQIYDWVTDEKSTYMAMEWVDGITLSKSPFYLGSQALADEDIPGPGSGSRTIDKVLLPPSYKEGLKIVLVIAQALQQAHELGIVHRDLKPDNIMLTEDGSIKILDFGIAKIAERDPGNKTTTERREKFRNTIHSINEALNTPSGAHTAITGESNITRAGSTIGSLGYMSPEQAFGEQVSPAGDIFVLGIILHEILTGKNPFRGKGEALLDSVKNDHRIPIPTMLNGKKIPRALAKLLESMLTHDVEDRPSAEEVCAAIQTYLKPSNTFRVVVLASAISIGLTAVVYNVMSRGTIHDLVKSGSPRIVILPVINATDDSSQTVPINVGMTEILNTSLRQATNKLNVVAADDVYKMYNTLKFDANTPLTEAQVKLLCDRLNAALVLRNKLSGTKTSLTFEYVLSDRSGKVRYQDTALSLMNPQLYQELSTKCVSKLARSFDPFGKAQVPSTEIVSTEVLNLYALGVDLHRKAKYNEAIIPLRQCAYLAPHFTQGVMAYANTLSSLGKSDEGIAVSWWALLNATAQGDSKSIGRSYYLLSAFLNRVGEKDKAKRTLDTAISILDRTSSYEEIGLCHNLYSLIAINEGPEQFATSEAHARSAAEFFKKAGTPVREVLAKQTLAQVLYRQDQYAEAEHLAHECIEYYVKTEDHKHAIETWILMGNSYKYPEKMIEFNTKAVEYAEKHGVLEPISIGKLNVALGYLSKGDARKSKELLLELQKYTQEHEHAAGLALSTIYLGEIARLEGDMTRAHTLLMEGAELVSKTSYKADQAWAKASAAECLVRISPSNVAKAKELLASVTKGESDWLVSRVQAWIFKAQGDKTAAIIEMKSAISKFSAHDVDVSLSSLRDMQETLLEWQK